MYKETKLVLVTHLLNEHDYTELVKKTPMGTEVYSHWFPRGAIDHGMGIMVADNLNKSLIRSIRAHLLRMGRGVISGGKDVQSSSLPLGSPSP